MYPYVKFFDDHATAYPTPACVPDQWLGSVSLAGKGQRAQLRAVKELRQMFQARVAAKATAPDDFGARCEQQRAALAGLQRAA